MNLISNNYKILPKEGEVYYYNEPRYGECVKCIWNNTVNDIERYHSNNCFVNPGEQDWSWRS